MFPLSVNFHFTRLCNFNCGFCFHTQRDFKLLDIDDAKHGLSVLNQKCDLEKINLTGGEPLLHPSYLGELLEFCKEELNIGCTSTVTNGSLLSKEIVSKHLQYCDMVGVSIDSFSKKTNREIGRGNIKPLEIKEILEESEIAFKINTVVNGKNCTEDMTKELSELNPCRWKVFQCTIVPDENESISKEFLVTNEEFEEFVEKHKEVKNIVVESSEILTDSYLILDEKMRFLNCKTKIPGESILNPDVEMSELIKDAEFNVDNFKERDGFFFLDDLLYEEI